MSLFRPHRDNLLVTKLPSSGALAHDAKHTTRRRPRGLFVLGAISLVLPLLTFSFLVDGNEAAAASTITVSVAASADDARSTECCGVTTSERAALVGTGDGSKPNVNGFRFAGIQIPAGATVDSVNLSLSKQGDQWAQFDVELGFEATSNAAPFSANNAPGQRTRTTARSTVRNNQRWTNGNRYTLGDQATLARALQEVINRPDWKAGNSVAIIAYGAPTPAWSRLIFDTFDAGAAKAPQLTVTYRTAGSTPTSPSPSPSAKPSPSPSPSAKPSPSPSPVTSPSPSASASASPSSGPAPVAGQPCPAWLHDSYVTQGPDGKMYPTWHPPVDPTYGCFFGHEHGADPRTSNADNTMPAFGYASALLGMTEPHTGFKVFVINAGYRSEGTTATGDYRIVFHMGTSGVGRYTQQFHSLEYDYVARDGTGRYAHAYGMADTGTGVGSTCDTPRKGGRDFSTVGCDDPYEIWTFQFKVVHPSDPYTDAMHVRTFLSGSVAVFDPVTTRDPANPAQLLYSVDYYYPGRGIAPDSPNSPFLGCARESYGGPNYWNNAGRPTVYYTDPYGNVKPGPGPGLIKQETSALNSTANGLFKYRQDFCGGGIHAPN